MAFDEHPLIPSAAANPDVDRVSVSGDRLAISGDTPAGVWVVPDGVVSFSFLIAGGGGYTGVDPDDVPVAGPVPTAFYDVPCTPGDEWLLEGGDGIYYYNPVTASARNTFHGGNGYYPGGTETGQGGGGASVLWRRRPGELRICAVAGGWGGPWVNPVGSMDVPVAGGYTTGGLTAAPGSGSAGTSGSGGGGGGGWPGGAAGAATGDAGITGESYLPDTPFSSLGGPTSPTLADFGDSLPLAVPDLGYVYVWYFRPVSGWSIDEIKF